MELFDKKFVHFLWDDELKGKRGFLSSGIDTLIKMVNEDSDRTEIQKGCERDLPFCKHITVECRFAYYDPNYEVKKAYTEGKTIQFRCYDEDDDWYWVDCDVPYWNGNLEYRVKPEEKKWIAYLARENDGSCYLTACTDAYWESAQKEFGAKTKLFIGTHNEVNKWFESRQKFAEVIKAWEDGKTIQVYETLFKKWGDCAGTLEWYTDCEYRVKPEEKEEEMNDKMNPIQEKKMDRYNLNLGDWNSLKEMAVKMFKGIAALNERFARKISGDEFITQDDWKMMNGLWKTFNYTTDENEFCKDDLHHLFTEDDLDEEFVHIKAEVTKEEKDEKPECPCEDGIDSKACVGCEHSVDGKRKYKPYVTVDEFIQDFQERFPTAVPRPAYTMPLIWIAHKTDGTTRLIVEFSDRSVKIGCKVKPVDFGKLFEYWTYTDGSPVGMEVKE